MSPEARPVDFAVIGHLESWEKLYAVVQALRRPELPPLSHEDVRSIVPWIPPRKVVGITIRSTRDGRDAQGLYIDTFITPDELAPGDYRRNIGRVQDAAAVAIRAGARVAALGGFTSIVLEGDVGILPPSETTCFTTGNTLTTAYICKGVEAACSIHGLDLPQCSLLVVGATGDVGSGCVRYFAGRTRELLLSARNGRRLEQLKSELQAAGLASRVGTDPDALLREADIVILAASVSAPSFNLRHCRPHAVVCDAGYPRNARISADDPVTERLFHGGMGLVLGGYRFDPDLRHTFYAFPVPGIGHGCMLEGALLALAGRNEAFSQGRGHITRLRIKEIWRLAEQHGFTLAPFFNHGGLWTRQPLQPTEIAT